MNSVYKQIKWGQILRLRTAIGPQRLTKAPLRYSESNEGFYEVESEIIN